eukprot:CAMPEP_0117029618 /NCGR_PEP_ID=MMETSP0472-20121206/21430_1 /TAXON_ID=693140 ORGANISM="Tiarina fusus, Strain LIS" /NCGR_SAMPLE_ID=MMETSP0472 /ASSEMBLY_ACC=CAM_ASM_000603 /LENGTH=590 /DNA_ID=CAMNT_0004737431 /DNA_START=6 /DNA_END=1778 /DNA_ORIENTATION=+
MSRIFVLLAFFAVFALANRVRYQEVALELDETWEIVGRAPADQELKVRFALHQHNLDVLERTFMSVSDPTHPDFHKYWTKEQIMELVSPPLADQKLVVAWALESGCSSAESFGDFVEVLCPVSSLESMLGDVEITMVNDVRLNQTTPKIITGEYSLPRAISRVVEFVQNLAMNVHKRKLNSFRVPSRVSDTIRETARPRYQQPSEDQVIPATLYNLYNIDHTISTASSQSVAEFSNFGYLDSDLEAYDTGCAVPTPNKISAVGSFSPSPPNVECTLDVQMITSVGLNGTNFYYTVDGWVLDFAQELLQSNNPPMVNSISWSSDERTEGYSYNSRTDTEWQKLGTMGVSVLAASGDDGAVGTSRCSGNHWYFNPGYPATSPYITSVGATMLVGKPTTSSTEAPVCSEVGHTCAMDGTEEPADENLGGYATGGGFSVYETRPSYQNTAVNQYLNDNSIPKPPASYFNSSNRGFPDVAANGYNILIYRGGRWETVGGTSAATPIWGGVFALINDVLLSNQKQPLGFANPFLYSMFANGAGTFTNIGDLTTNNDDGCQYGYTSNPNGWDPVCGLGTPNVGKILAYVQSNLSMFP